MHYARFRQHGSPHVNLLDVPFSIAFWSNVTPAGPDECWVWTGKMNNVGYGRFNASGHKGLSHRVAYRSMVGEIPGQLSPPRCPDYTLP
jgi:hypothetical protein